MPQALAEHPGLAVAHAGRMTPAECEHPRARRDLKNPKLCLACCGTLPETAAKPRRGSAG